MSAEVNSDNSEHRNQETVLDGLLRKDSRSQLRAYNFLKKKAIQNGIPFPEFVPREKSAGKTTTRSQNWKKQQQLKQAAKGKTPRKPFCKLQSRTADCVHSLHLDKPSCSWENHTAKIIVSKKTVGMSAGTHSHNSEERNQETVRDGQRPMGSRNHLRAYNFQKKRAIANGIPFRGFEPKGKAAGKPTARSQNWKKQQQIKQAAKGKTSDKPFCELQPHTKPSRSWENHTAEIIVSKKTVCMSTGPHFHNSEKRNQETVQSGQQPMGSHNQLHAHSSQKKRAIQNGILFREFELREKAAGKLTARSQNWKKQQQIKQAAKGKTSDKPFCELQPHTKPSRSWKNHTAEIIVSKKTVGMSTGPNSHNSEERNQETVQDGQQPMGSRNQLHAHSTQKKRAIQNGILFSEKTATKGKNPDKRFDELQSYTDDCLYRLDPDYSFENRTAKMIVSKKSFGNPKIERNNPDKSFCALKSHTANCARRLDPDYSEESSYNLGPILLAFQFPKYLLESPREESLVSQN